MVEHTVLVLLFSYLGDLIVMSYATRLVALALIDSAMQQCMAETAAAGVNDAGSSLVQGSDRVHHSLLGL